MRGYRRIVVALLVLSSGLGCVGGEQNWVLPDPDEAAEWFGEDVAGTIDGNVLEIRATTDPDFLRRGGRIWARSGPYFYLFNVHVQRLFEEYPDLAAVRATTFSEDGEMLAVAMLHRQALNEPRWREALGRSSLAQQQGTENPRVVERLIQFGEDYTTFEYAPAAH